LIYAGLRSLRSKRIMIAHCIALIVASGAALLSGLEQVIADQTSASAGLPARAPGMWRITTVSPEIGMQTNEVCIEGNDKIIGAWGAGCDQPAVESVKDGMIVTIGCLRSDAKEVTSLYFTGDLKKSYRAQSRTTITNVKSGASVRTGFTIEAKFLTLKCTAPR
jgi:hypothetical protein